MYLKSSILHSFNRHTSSFLPSHRKSLTGPQRNVGNEPRLAPIEPSSLPGVRDQLQTAWSLLNSAPTSPTFTMKQVATTSSLQARTTEPNDRLDRWVPALSFIEAMCDLTTSATFLMQHLVHPVSSKCTVSAEPRYRFELVILKWDTAGLIRAKRVRVRARCYNPNY
jgi:hypothetical protein